MVTSRLAALVLCVVAVAACAACGADNTSAAPPGSAESCPGRPPPTPTTPDVGQPDDSGVFGTPADIDEINEVLTTEYVDAFAGLKVCDGSTLAIYRLPDHGLDEVGLQDRFKEVLLVFRDAEVSDADSRALIDQVTADLETWKRRGVDITTVQASLTGRVLIGIRGEATSEIQGWLTDAYGPGIDVKHRGAAIPL